MIGPTSLKKLRAVFNNESVPAKRPPSKRGQTSCRPLGKPVFLIEHPPELFVCEVARVRHTGIRPSAKSVRKKQPERSNGVAATSEEPGPGSRARECGTAAALRRLLELLWSKSWRVHSALRTFSGVGSKLAPSELELHFSN